MQVSFYERLLTGNFTILSFSGPKGQFFQTIKVNNETFNIIF
jgi:hypothetical protein